MCLEATRSSKNTVQKIYDIFEFDGYKFIVMDKLGSSL
jgi:hypothetical protein